MEWDFKSVLEDELVKLEWFYSFGYFNNVLTEEELNCISIMVKSHRSVIKVLGGNKSDKVSKVVL